MIGGTGFTGLIDEVKVYNRVLNESEILSAMKVKGLNIADTNPTVNYRRNVSDYNKLDNRRRR